MGLGEAHANPASTKPSIASVCTGLLGRPKRSRPRVRLCCWGWTGSLRPRLPARRRLPGTPARGCDGGPPSQLALVSWTPLVVALSRAGRRHDALRRVTEMRALGVRCDSHACSPSRSTLLRSSSPSRLPTSSGQSRSTGERIGAAMTMRRSCRKTTRRWGAESPRAPRGAPPPSQKASKRGCMFVWNGEDGSGSGDACAKTSSLRKRMARSTTASSRARARGPPCGAAPAWRSARVCPNPRAAAIGAGAGSGGPEPGTAP
ncbi:hypothetical protein ACQ4PT_027687 [Festuca glaucescens]